MREEHNLHDRIIRGKEKKKLYDIMMTKKKKKMREMQK